jgi:hypothetical protein
MPWTSGSAKDLGEMMAHPVPHAHILNLDPLGAFFFCEKGVKMQISHFFGRHSRNADPTRQPKSDNLNPKVHLDGLRVG